MTLSEFQALVDSHPDSFRGVHPHPRLAFDAFEKALGYQLPETLRWLLGNHGYSACCGVDNLDEAVARTLECRESILMPDRWLLLNDWGDAGIVLLDLPTGRVCWCGSERASTLADGEVGDDADWFDGYPEWVASRLAEAD